jgi:hypothetical protein
MQVIAEVVELYLTMDTSYAVMITGAWGSGKTFYVRQNLVPLVERTPLFHDGSRHYRPVLLSLFGQKSVEDVQAAILLSLFPVFGNKFAKLGGNLLKGLFKGALKLGGLDQLAELASDVHVDKKDWIKFEDLVLIFDDLERRHKDLALEELLGFINSLVETGNNKILIITNEGSQQDAAYHALKEKTVGITVHFRPDLTSSMRNLIEKRFASSPVYRQYLLDNGTAVTELFITHSSNLRVFAFWLSYFQFVFSALDDVLAGIDPLEQQRAAILLQLLRFSMAIAIEYKSGEISYGNANGLDRESYLPIPALFMEQANRQKRKETKEPPKNFHETFEDKYYSDRPYRFYPSLFNLVTGGGKLKLEELRIELKQQYHVTDVVIPPPYVRYNQLRYMDVFSLEDPTYIQLTQQLFEDAKAGLFGLATYPSAFHFLTRFNNPLGFDLTDLKDKIIAGMRLGKAHYVYLPHPEMHFQVSVNDEHPALLSEIVRAILALNEELKTEASRQTADDLQQLFFNDPDAFYTAVSDRHGAYYLTPVFDQFPIQDTCQYLLQLPNPSLVRFIDFLRRRFKDFTLHSLSTEKAFFTELADKLDQDGLLSSLEKGLRWFIVRDLATVLDEYKNILPDLL